MLTLFILLSHPTVTFTTMFKFVMQLSIVSFVFSFLAVAYALPVVIRDVFVPPVTSPTTGTVWTIGSQQNVTWYVLNTLWRSDPSMLTCLIVQGHLERPPADH